MMKRPLSLAQTFTHRMRPLIALLMLAVLSVALPLSQARPRSVTNPLDKLSLALQRALGNNDAEVWADSSRQTVRALI
jgi:hypothetical protein